ncbi:MAG TPA: phospho-N-acetylmuramoyl-pentapeptide-transferase [Candidatus Paceibacterota bacterium]|nr:phospho-N-acetylmuramoyl-pentapeptide-transferase [Verrucomicrobiota bacterium]HSA11007.1 phospho-N-acetylmuramoyl-pentapeptide-transferase [Candidatus Paceibacterota bacterium]
MLYFFAPLLTECWGPIRLLGSHLVLIGIGAILAAWLSWLALWRWRGSLPLDRGRAFTPNSTVAVGKPTGAGFIMVLSLIPVLFLVVPLSGKMLQVNDCLALAMLTGFLDDRSALPWGEVRKGLLDLGVAALASFVLCQGQPMTIWLPFVKGSYILTPVGFVLLGTALLWITMNATNCSDGVDGLAGSLTLLSLFSLGALLYGVIGHKKISAYLLLPHNPEGAAWAVLIFSAAGALAGYLWHNAEPSRMLMGDAGSRYLGLLLGIAVLASGNPFLVLVVAPVVLLNGGTGLAKLALLRTFRRLGFDTSPGPADSAAGAKGKRLVGVAPLLHKVRFPLHDHCRKNLGWSNAQVLMRFLLLQAFLTPLLIVLLFKVR